MKWRDDAPPSEKEYPGIAPCWASRGSGEPWVGRACDVRDEWGNTVFAWRVIDEPEPYVANMTSRRAAELANRLGIYAVPVNHDGKFYWRPRMPSGNDPDLRWLLDAEPTKCGWNTWAEAVVDLGDYLESEEATNR